MSKKNKKPLTKAKKNLLITLLVLVVMGASVLILTLIPTAEQAEEQESGISSSESSEEEETISLLNKQASDVDHIDVVNQSDSFTIRYMEQDASEEEDEENSSFEIEGLDPNVYPVLATAVNSAAKYGYTVTAQKLIGDAADYNLDEFGLEDPVVQMTTTFSDGTAPFSYAIGDSSATGSGYYLLVDGKIYVGDSSEYLKKRRMDFCTTKIVSIDTSEDDTVVFSNIQIVNENGEMIIVPQERKGYISTFSMRKPFTCSANDDTVTALQEDLVSVTARSVVGLSPTDEDLEKYGLLDPVASVIYTYKDSTYKLLAGGKNEDGNRYVMLDGGNVVYAVSDNGVSKWVEATPISLREKFVMLITINDVQQLTFDVGSQKYAFTLSRTVNEESSTENSTVYDYAVKGTNGQELTYKTFQKFYQLLIGEQMLSDADFDSSMIEGKTPDITLTYHYYDTMYEDDVIEFYKSGTRRYLVAVNGDVSGYVTETSVNKMVDSAVQMEEDAYKE